MKASPCVGLFCEVNMRNDLLADIVTALGGTVTDRNNRNLLLNDWLTAVKTPAIEYVAQLDGLTKYWQLSETINLVASDIVELGFIGGSVTNSFAMFVESDSRNFYLSVTSDSLAFRVKAAFGTPMLNGNEIVSNTTPVPVSGENVISAATVGNEVLSLLGGRVGGSLLMNLPLYNLRVIRGGVVIHEIPLTNKSQGATQLATVGTINATMIGYTGNEWVDRSAI